MEEYGYNPNDDPTLPAVGAASTGAAAAEAPEMREEGAGYRGWGNSAAARNPSSSAAGAIGMAVSDDGHAYQGSSDPLVEHPGRAELEGGGVAAGAAGIAGAAAYRRRSRTQDGVQRGTSNASSSYSTAAKTDQSDDAMGSNDQHGYDSNYSQYTPYNPGVSGYTSYDPSGGQPVVRDVSARRNTRIENGLGGQYPQQGSSGIAQNF